MICSFRENALLLLVVKVGTDHFNPTRVRADSVSMRAALFLAYFSSIVALWGSKLKDRVFTRAPAPF